jgi:hypothetical protein
MMPNTMDQRIQRVGELLSMLEPVPADWLVGVEEEKAKREGSNEPLKSLPCTDYFTLLAAWRVALEWRPEMDDVLSVMLAVALSTEQVGDQLFLQVIGDAGGGKTRFCEGMLVSFKCLLLESITGFYSGYNDGTGKDYSFIARANRKCWITPEGDLMMKNPKFHEIMAQQRRIFDGSIGATFKTKDKDTKYTGLRTPWIMAGTPAMLTGDQAQLGDRFLRIFIKSPDDEGTKAILKSVVGTAIRSVRQTSNGMPESQLEKNLCKAYQLTGGYVNWLVSNAENLLVRLRVDEEMLERVCPKMGEFVAKMRARPLPGDKDIETSSEMPTRLTHQFVRLACCIAVVLNKQEIDSEVMRRVTKVAVDTSRGVGLDIVRQLYKHREGMCADGISVIASREKYTVRRMLDFYRKQRVVERFEEKHERARGIWKWRLTERMRALYEEIFS